MKEPLVLVVVAGLRARRAQRVLKGIEEIQEIQEVLLDHRVPLGH
jgi:hypothetical protein